MRSHRVNTPDRRARANEVRSASSGIPLVHHEGQTWYADQAWSAMGMFGRSDAGLFRVFVLLHAVPVQLGVHTSICNPVSKNISGPGTPPGRVSVLPSNSFPSAHISARHPRRPALDPPSELVTAYFLNVLAPLGLRDSVILTTTLLVPPRFSLPLKDDNCEAEIGLPPSYPAAHGRRRTSRWAS